MPELPPAAISVVDSQPRLVAAVRRQATLAQVPTLAVSSPVWGQVYGRNIETTGIGVIIYWDDGKETLTGPTGVPTDFCVEVLEPFEGDATLAFAKTPAGRTATVRHFGSYAGLPGIHRDIRDWAGGMGEKLAGPNWEIYSHWHEDEAQRITDVYYLLA